MIEPRGNFDPFYVAVLDIEHINMPLLQQLGGAQH